MEPQFITIPLSEYQQLVTAAQEISTLRAELESIEERLSREIALDRQRISKLEQIEEKPQPRQLNQSEVLRALLAANGGKMLQSEAIRKMAISKSDFSKLLRTVKNDIKSKPYYKDRRKNLLELL